MTTNADRLRQVMLRHRADGYLRFDLPSGLCTGPPAATLRTALDGVYRVSFYPTHDKLAIRFHPAACDVARVACALAQGLSTVEAEGLSPGCERCAARAAEETSPSWLKSRLMNLKAVRWVRAKAEAVREGYDAVRQLSLARFKKVPDVLQTRKRRCTSSSPTSWSSI